MTLARFSSWLLPLAGLSLALVGCLSPPDYPVEPSIEFKSLAVTRYTPPGEVPVDTFKITISFKDGDGDLGITDEEVLFPPNAPSYTPYSAQNPDGSSNPNQYNYLLRVYQRVKGTSDFIEYAPFETTSFGRYPPLNGGPDAKPAPLKGDLVHIIPLAFGSPLNAGDEVKFTVSIKDRAFHESNIITTSTYLVPAR